MFGLELSFGFSVATFFIVSTSLLFGYWYITWNDDYWKKKGLPYVRPAPIIGSLLETFRTPFHEIEYNRYFKLGPVYGHFEASKPLLSIADPALLRDIFVKDFQFFTTRRHFSTGEKIFDNMLFIMAGEDWKRVRTIVSPTFSTGKIKRVMGIFNECSKTILLNFMKLMEEGKPVNCKRMYGAFAMDVIASSAFSTKIDSHNNPDNKLVKNVRSIFECNNLNWRFIFFLLLPRLMKLLKVSIFAPDAMDFFKDVTLQIINERKRTGQVRNDFLQLLMDTSKEDNEEQKKTEESEIGDVTSNYGEQDVAHQIFKNVTSKKLSTDEMIAQCVVFFIAGYDTSASTLSFATHFLALNPAVQDKLRAEIDRALKESNVGKNS